MNEISMERPDRMAMGAQIQMNQHSQAVTSVKTNESGKVMPKEETEGKELAAIEPEQVQDAVSRINEYVQQSERSLEFRMDDTSGRTVIKVFDKQSDELIRQIPSELALELAQKLNDEEPSLLFSAQV